MSNSRSRLVASAAVVAASGLALAGCVFVPFPVSNDSSSSSSSSSSTPATDFEVSDSVHGLLLETAADVDVVIGETPALDIRGPQSSVSRITVAERGGILVIGNTGPGFTMRDVEITLTVVAFDELELAGAGDIDADFSTASDVSVTVRGAGDVDATGIDAQSVTVVIDGAGAVDLSGTADSAEYRINGAGDLDASDLIVIDATAHIDGAGSIEVHATGSVDARTSGIGDISIRGGASVTRQVDGLGTITEE